MGMGNSAITITTGTILRALLLILLLGLIYYLRDLVLVIITAVVLASAIEPAIKWFAKKSVPRLPSVIIIYLLLAIALVGLVYFFVPPLLEEAVGFLSRLPEDLQQINISDITGNSKFLTETLPTIESAQFNDAAGSIKDIAATLSGNFFKTTGVIFGGVFSFILIVVLSFYFAAIETGVDDFLRIISPVSKQEYVVGLWKRAQIKIGLWMQGQVLLGLIVGVLVYLGLTVLGVPYAFFMAILAAAFELIPVFGPILAAVPAVILAFVDAGLSAGLFTVGLYVIIQQFENHLIYPLVVRKVVGVPPIMVIIALIAGAKLAGFLGIILSVPVSAALKEYVDDVQRSKEMELRKLSSEYK